MLHMTYDQLKYSSPSCSKNTPKTRATQKSLPFRKWRFREKQVKRMGQKQKRIRQKSNRTRQKNKRGDILIDKCDETVSPEIPDRGETSEITGLPLGACHINWRQQALIKLAQTHVNNHYTITVLVITLGASILFGIAAHAMFAELGTSGRSLESQWIGLLTQ